MSDDLRRLFWQTVLLSSIAGLFIFGCGWLLGGYAERKAQLQRASVAPSHLIMGQVRGASGNFVPFCPVMIDYQDGRHFEVRTNADGFFAVGVAALPVSVEPRKQPRRFTRELVQRAGVVQLRELVTDGEATKGESGSE